MIDPLRHRLEAAHTLASTPARMNPLLSARPDQLISDLAAGRQLSPAQSQQILVLVRATIESFAAPARDGHSVGTLGTLRAAQASLGELQRNLALRLTSHQDQVTNLAPILHSLMLSALGDEPADAAPHAIPNFMRDEAHGTLPSNGSSGEAHEMLPANGSTRAAPAPSTPPGSSSIASLAQSLGEAVARVQETLSLAPLIPGVPPHETDPPDAFRWVLDTALMHTAGPVRPLPIQGEAGRLVTLAHDLLDAFATTATPASVVPKTNDVVRNSAEPSLKDPRGDLAAVLDRYPGVVRVLTPVLRELGLAAGNAEPAPASATAALAEVFAAAVARGQVLASLVLAEAQELGAPALNRQLLAECVAAGMPPFSMPVELRDNIDTLRWLLIATQLYNSWRLAPRTPLQRCNRCGRTLQRTGMGILTCPKCG